MIFDSHIWKKNLKKELVTFSKFINSSKIEKEIGWRPKYNFDDALKQTVEWYLQNKSWWESLIDENTLHPQPWTIKQ